MERRSIAIALVVSLTCLFSVNTVYAQDLPLLTLEKCIEKGLRNDPQLVQSEAALKRSSNNMWTSYGRFLPSVSAGLNYSWSSRQQVAEYVQKWNSTHDSLIIVPVYINDSYGSSFSVNENLFSGFSDYFTLKSSQKSRKAASKSYDTQVLSTIYNIKTNYFNVLKAMKLSEVQKKAKERSDEQLRITQTRYELGSAALSDVLKAKVASGDVELSLIAAENNYKISMAQLNQLIGEDVTKMFRVDSTIRMQDVELNLDEAISYAQEHNPNLQALKLAMEASSANVRAAWGGYLPSLDFHYSSSYYQPDKLHLANIFSDNHNYNYGLSLSLNIFDRFMTKSQISNAKVSLNTDKFNYYNYLNGLNLEVTVSFLNLEEARLSMDVSRDKLASAQEDYKLAEEKYSLGAATILDLLDAELSLKTAESDIINSEYSLNLAVANLEKSLGINK